MPLFWLSCAFLGGVLFSSWIAASSFIWLGLAAILFIFQVLLWKGCLPRLRAKLQEIGYAFLPPSFFELSLKVPVAIVGVVFLLGAARYQAVQPQSTADQLIFYNDRSEEWYIRGVIVEPPILKDQKTQLVVAVQEISSLNVPSDVNIKAKGKLLLATRSSESFLYGDEIAFNSKLSSPKEEEGFSYKIFLATKGIYTLASSNLVKITSHNHGNWLLAALYTFRRFCLDFIMQNYPPPQSFLLSGILLGEEEYLTPQLSKAFQDTGTAHIIAISGFNMTLISGLFAAVFGKLLGSKRGIAAALLGVALYVLMLGANAAVLRAAIMSSLALIARQFGRPQHGLNALLFSSSIMCFPNPLLLWDVSFQLSFGATLGLILYAEPLQRGFFGLISHWLPKTWVSKVTGWASEYFLMTIAAQITTLPIIFSHFGRLSINALYVNPLILPAQPIVMVLGGASVLLGVFVQPLGQLLAWAALPFLTYTIKVVEWFAEHHRAVLSIPPLPLYGAFLYAVLLLGLTLFGQRLFNERLRQAAVVAVLCVLAAANILVWQMIFATPQERLTLTILDVEDGEALLLQTPKGQKILINGGERASLLADALGRRMPILQRSLDAVIIASAKTEAIKALERVIAWYPPRRVVWATLAAESPSARVIRTSAAEVNADNIYMEYRDTLVIDGDVELQLLHRSNKGSAFLLRWQRLKVLLLGSIDETILKNVGQSPSQSVTVIWLGKNAARTKLPLAWFSRLQPHIMLVSAPSALSLQQLEQWNNAALLDTQRNGWIELISDGEDIWIEAQKN